MKRALLPTLVLVALLAAGAGRAKAPVVVELFTAQGCASCGQADSYLARLDEQPATLTLAWSVDYWDYLGWKDTFAQPDFTERQRAYDKRFGLHDVYTPQIVVDGAAQVSGDKASDIDALIRQARHARTRQVTPVISPRADGSIAIATAPGAHPRSPDDVWLVRYDPRLQEIQVRAGDNKGKTITLRNAVRQVSRLGQWTGRHAVFKLPPPTEEGLATVILVQIADGGRIVGVLKISPKG
jgi:hypothetical protein